MDLVLATIAYRRDWLPNIIPADNMCKKKTSNEAHPKAACTVQSVNQSCKDYHFNQSINLVKIVAKDEALNTKGYVRVHITTFRQHYKCLNTSPLITSTVVLMPYELQHTAKRMSAVSGTGANNSANSNDGMAFQ